MWSWVLEGIGLTGAYFAGRKKWWSWGILLANAVLWVVYGLVSHQYGFVAASGFYLVVYTKNLLHWRSTRHLL
ncbi:MAG: hypothetical protein EBS66_10810 [Betaproteobacteria bacterium]|nr:hypothetical protein [Betaproteobacteria bacterium]